MQRYVSSTAIAIEISQKLKVIITSDLHIIVRGKSMSKMSGKSAFTNASFSR